MTIELTKRTTCAPGVVAVHVTVTVVQPFASVPTTCTGLSGVPIPVLTSATAVHVAQAKTYWNR